MFPLHILKGIHIRCGSRYINFFQIDYFFESNVTTLNEFCKYIEFFMKTNPDNFTTPAHSSLSSSKPVELSKFQNIETLSRKIARNIIVSGYQKHGNTINRIRRNFLNELKENRFEKKINMIDVNCEENSTLIEAYMFEKINEYGLNKDF